MAGSSLHTAKPIAACPYCGGRRIIRKGVRRNKYGKVQIFYCHYCRKKFTPLVNKHKSFPLRVILHAITEYNRLHILEEAAATVSRKYGIAVSRQNLKNWLTSFREYLPFARLRPLIAERYDRHQAFLESQLLHGLVYAFKYHRAKADLIVGRSKEHAVFHPLQTFLENVPRQTPHNLFRDQRVRASTHKPCFDLDGVQITPKDNAAVKNARVVLQAVANNKLRHEVLQEFMLVNDSVTVAVEVPVTLTEKDIRHFRDILGFTVPFNLGDQGVVTGHIDIIQIRHGMIHILDYKPNAKKIKPIEQLTIYALALSRLTNLRLYHFKCAWFDDENYFEFYPLTVVHKKKGR
jgi:transposase-like protein